MLRLVVILSLIVASTYAEITAWINEFHYRNVGEDKDVFLEIAGPASEEGWRYMLVMYQGRNGTQFHEGLSLSGHWFNEGINGDFGFFSLDLPSRGAIRKGKNGGDAIALVKDSECVQFFSYGDNNDETFTAYTGPCYGATSVNIGAHEPRNTPLGYSLQMHGTGRYMSNFTWYESPMAATKNAVNVGQTLQTQAEYDAAASSTS